LETDPSQCPLLAQSGRPENNLLKGRHSALGQNIFIELCSRVFELIEAM